MKTKAYVLFLGNTGLVMPEEDPRYHINGISLDEREKHVHPPEPLEETEPTSNAARNHRRNAGEGHSGEFHCEGIHLFDQTIERCSRVVLTMPPDIAAIGDVMVIGRAVHEPVVEARIDLRFCLAEFVNAASMPSTANNKENGYSIEKVMAPVSSTGEKKTMILKLGQMGWTASDIAQYINMDEASIQTTLSTFGH